jgi:hypothetical protein
MRIYHLYINDLFYFDSDDYYFLKKEAEDKINKSSITSCYILNQNNNKKEYEYVAF